jgi:hypothetical protein
LLIDGSFCDRASALRSSVLGVLCCRNFRLG